MAINPAFLGHGIFTEFSIMNALTRFEKYGAPPGSPPPTDAQRIERFIRALKDMQISTVWIQLFTTTEIGDVEPSQREQDLRKELIRQLGLQQINWAGWGFCASWYMERDLGLIENFKNDLHMSAFVIDAEPNKDDDEWTKTNFDTFTDKVNRLFRREDLAVSTWPVLQIKETSEGPVSDLMDIAKPRVSLFAPQAYWLSYPIGVHYFNRHVTREKYKPNNSTAFVRLVVDAWAELGYDDLVITGQAYWGEGAACPPQGGVETKLDEVGEQLPDAYWNKLYGFNWYHAGGNNTVRKGSMSKTMMSYIKNRNFAGKPFRSG